MCTACGCNLPSWVPLQIGQGTTVKFTRTFFCYPVTDWTYTIFFNGAAKFSAAAVPYPDPVAGPHFLVTIPAADTASKTPGPYRYCERVTSIATSEVYDLTGEYLATQLAPSAADAPAGAFQTFEEKTIPVLEAALAGDKTPGVQSYSIAGRSVSMMSKKELGALLGTYRSVVYRQQHPGALGGPAYGVAFPFTEGYGCGVPPTWIPSLGYRVL